MLGNLTYKCKVKVRKEKQDDGESKYMHLLQGKSASEFNGDTWNYCRDSLAKGERVCV